MASVIQADCLEAMRAMETDSVDAVVTDPPAGIAFMGKHWDGDRGGRRQWIAWLAERMAEALRVLKPGGHTFVWALPRTSHWTGAALEDAGFEIRDVVTHVQGQGFPKSKALLKPSSEHWILCRKPGPLRHLRISECRVGTADDTARSNATMGYGGNVRPFTSGGASGRWPANFVLSHSPGCVETGTAPAGPRGGMSRNLYGGESLNLPEGYAKEHGTYADPDGTEEVAAWTCAPGCPVALLDAQSGLRPSGGRTGKYSGSGITFGRHGQAGKAVKPCAPGTGTASRYFHCFEPDPFVYQAKASRRDRGAGNTHPTVKSVALMRHLVRLVAAPGDLVLDPFAGSGSTGVAALAEGCLFIGIELDADSVAMARRRLGMGDQAPDDALDLTDDNEDAYNVRPTRLG